MIYPKNLGGADVENNNDIDEQIQHWNMVKSHQKLKSRIRKGIPQQLRTTIWQNLSGARERRKIECARYGSKALYMDLKGRKKSKYHDKIWRNIHKRYNKYIFVASTPQEMEQNASPTQIAIYHVLKAFSLYRRDIGYCEGMEVVVAWLLKHFREEEEEAFWMLASLADDTKYQMDNLWRPSQPAQQLRLYQMKRLRKLLLPK
eukprot:6197_1